MISFGKKLVLIVEKIWNVVQTNFSIIINVIISIEFGYKKVV